MKRTIMIHVERSKLSLENHQKVSRIAMEISPNDDRFRDMVNKSRSEMSDIVFSITDKPYVVAKVETFLKHNGIPYEKRGV
jgi:hypothetical protein